MRESSSLANSILALISEPLDNSNTTVRDAHPQLAKFYVSKLPKQREDGSWEDPVLPEFYAIPKIHKNLQVTAQSFHVTL